MTNSGPKPYDPLLMFKILVLQRYYNLSDGQIEYQILDRLSFCRFLGLSLNDRVPDEKTIWDFRDRLVGKGLDKELFDQFAGLLEKHGLIAHEGKIIDASFVEAPRQAQHQGLEQADQGRHRTGRMGESFQTRKGKRTPMPLDKEEQRNALRVYEPRQGRQQTQANRRLHHNGRIGTRFPKPWTACWTKKTKDKIYGQTVPILAKTKRKSSANTKSTTRFMQRGIRTNRSPMSKRHRTMRNQKQGQGWNTCLVLWNIV
jgi:IS5 family transposase